MLEIYIKLLPVFGFFFLGVALRYLKLATYEHGALLLKMVFFATLPVLILVRVAEAELTLDKLYLPFINMAINLGCMSVMLVVTRKMQIARATLGVMLVSSALINDSLLYPFVSAVLDKEAFLDLVIFDIGNAVMAVTVAYAVAFHYGEEGLEFKTIFINILKLPALWALVIALALNVSSTLIPAAPLVILEPFGMLTNPFILLSLGIYFNPRIKNLRLLSITIIIRMFVGLLIGCVIVTVLDLSGSSYIIVLLCSAAPMGFNTLTYASLAKLDIEFASSVVSISILIALFTIPFMMYFLQA
jgi:malate permease and related proteins